MEKTRIKPPAGRENHDSRRGCSPVRPEKPPFIQRRSIRKAARKKGKQDSRQRGFGLLSGSTIYLISRHEALLMFPTVLFRMGKVESKK